MSTGVASDLDTKSLSRGGGAERLAIFAAKLVVTVLLIPLAADRLEPGLVSYPAVRFSLGRLCHPGGVADPALGPALAQHFRCAGGVTRAA
jgi:hypothetical protein